MPRVVVPDDAVLGSPPVDAENAVRVMASPHVVFANIDRPRGDRPRGLTHGVGFRHATQAPLTVVRL